jgi:hypothetical protein
LDSIRTGVDQVVPPLTTELVAPEHPDATIVIMAETNINLRRRMRQYLLDLNFSGRLTVPHQRSRHAGRTCRARLVGNFGRKRQSAGPALGAETDLPG